MGEHLPELHENDIAKRLLYSERLYRYIWNIWVTKFYNLVTYMHNICNEHRNSNQSCSYITHIVFEYLLSTGLHISVFN